MISLCTEYLFLEPSYYINLILRKIILQSLKDRNSYYTPRWIHNFSYFGWIDYYVIHSTYRHTWVYLCTCTYRYRSSNNCSTLVHGQTFLMSCLVHQLYPKRAVLEEINYQKDPQGGGEPITNPWDMDIGGRGVGGCTFLSVLNSGWSCVFAENSRRLSNKSLFFRGWWHTLDGDAVFLLSWWRFMLR